MTVVMADAGVPANRWADAPWQIRMQLRNDLAAYALKLAAAFGAATS